MAGQFTSSRSQQRAPVVVAAVDVWPAELDVWLAGAAARTCRRERCVMRVEPVGAVCDELRWALPAAANPTNEGAQDAISSPPSLWAFGTCPNCRSGPKVLTLVRVTTFGVAIASESPVSAGCFAKVLIRLILKGAQPRMTTFGESLSDHSQAP